MCNVGEEGMVEVKRREGRGGKGTRGMKRNGEGKGRG